LFPKVRQYENNSTAVGSITTDLSNKFASPSGFERNKFLLSITAKLTEFPSLSLHMENTIKHRQKNIHEDTILKRILS
jgi:hypothetical protein